MQKRSNEKRSVGDTATAPDPAALLVARSHSVARVLKVLANQKRLLILCRLASAGETTVTALAETVGLSQSALSQHLAKMREEGVVTYRRVSQTLYYSIGDQQIERLLVALEEIYCPELAR